MLGILFMYTFLTRFTILIIVIFIPNKAYVLNIVFSCRVLYFFDFHARLYFIHSALEDRYC